MKVTQIYLLLHLFVTTSVVTFNPLNYFSERCDSKWISFDATGLQTDLQTKLFGQHIASPLILKVVSRFMENNDPKKPLVLSLHGPTGTGKNLVSSLIARNVYVKGMDSSFVHLFIATVHFPYKERIETYKSQLKQWIQGNVTQCERSMFIFDNMDHMHPGLIDTISPFLNRYHKIDGVSYRKVIFIFLSNAGAEIITQTALEFWKKGSDRKAIKLKDLERGISESVFKSKTLRSSHYIFAGGFWQSYLIEKNVMDFFVPFLPLEYQHVVQCIMAAMKAKGRQQKQDAAERIARNEKYYPKFERVFSITGCKSIDKRMFFDSDI